MIFTSQDVSCSGNDEIAWGFPCPSNWQTAHQRPSRAMLKTKTSAVIGQTAYMPMQKHREAEHSCRAGCLETKLPIFTREPSPNPIDL
jgi:hypothetical protein